MKLIRRKDFNDLLNVKQVPCASIYMPVNPLNRDGMNDPLLWKQLLNRSKEQLEAQGHSKQLLESLFAPGFELPSTLAWKSRQQTLAMFLSPNFSRCLSLETPLIEESWTDDHFHLRPLLPLVVESDRFFLLAISENRVHLYDGNSERLNLCEVPNLPESVQQVLDIEDADRGSQVHSGGQGSFGKAGAVYHGHGGVKDTANANRSQFIHRIAKSVDHFLQSENAPLILMAVENLAARWHDHSHYPNLMLPGIHGSPDHLTLAQMHAQALLALQPALRKEQTDVWRAYQDIRSTPRTAMGLHQVLSAAHSGRIDTLFLACSQPVWGQFDAERSIAHMHHSPQPGDGDLLEEALVATKLHGGRAFPLPIDDVDLQEHAVALLRY